MALTVYHALVPVAAQMLKNLSKILDRAAAHADAHRFDPNALLTARLFPDMFALVKQVQVATDMVKAGAARLAGAEIPSFPDEEQSFDDLQARIAKVVGFLESLDAAAFDGAEDREIRFKIREHAFEFTGRAYLQNWVLPNFYFHLTTAYNILRHNGVPIGKRDFLG